LQELSVSIAVAIAANIKILVFMKLLF